MSFRPFAYMRLCLRIWLLGILTVLLLLAALPALAASHTLCSDGLDNDADGLIDYPQDPQCGSALSVSEGTPSPLTISVSDGREFAEPGALLTYRILVRNPGDSPRAYALRTRLPQEASFVSATGNFVRSTYTIQWKTEVLPPKEERAYTLTVLVESGAPGLYALRLQAFAAGALESGGDTTHVAAGVPFPAVSLSMDDGKSEAAHGEELAYTIQVGNLGNVLLNDVAVVATLPIYAEFVSATEGGRLVSTNQVRWEHLTLSPRGKRNLDLTARVRSDAPLMARLQGTALFQNAWATDVTVVARREVLPPSLSEIFLRKVADRAEVQPGDPLTYTIVVRNTTKGVVRNLFVSDRFDQRLLILLRGAEDAEQKPDRLVWRIGELQPGETWQRRYTVRVSPDLAHGTLLGNIVTVGGEDIAELSLTERVRTLQTGVVASMPTTGSALDMFFLILTSLLGFGQVLVQKRVQ